MAKRTKAEVEADIAALQRELADDEDVELWVEIDGKRTKLTGDRARRWIKKHGFDDDDEDQGDADGKGDKDGEDGDPEAPKTNLRGKFFKAG